MKATELLTSFALAIGLSNIGTSGCTEDTSEAQIAARLQFSNAEKREAEFQRKTGDVTSIDVYRNTIKDSGIKVGDIVSLNEGLNNNVYPVTTSNPYLVDESTCSINLQDNELTVLHFTHGKKGPRDVLVFVQYESDSPGLKETACPLGTAFWVSLKDVRKREPVIEGSKEVSSAHVDRPKRKKLRAHYVGVGLLMGTTYTYE